jgi:hypothetical protein
MPFGMRRDKRDDKHNGRRDQQPEHLDARPNHPERMPGGAYHARETATDVPGILHAVQAHGSTRGAAGPTAGQPQEEMQPHPPRALAARLTSAVGSVREGTLRRMRWLRPSHPRRPDVPASSCSSP